MQELQGFSVFSFVLDFMIFDRQHEDFSNGGNRHPHADWDLQSFTLWMTSSVFLFVSCSSCFFMLSLKLDFFFLNVFLIRCVCFVLEISQRHRSFRHQSLTIAKWLKVLTVKDFFFYTKREPPKSFSFTWSRFPMWSWFLLAILASLSLAKREEEDVMMVQRQGF